MSEVDSEIHGRKEATEKANSPFSHHPDASLNQPVNCSLQLIINIKKKAAYEECNNSLLKTCIWFSTV